MARKFLPGDRKSSDYEGDYVLAYNQQYCFSKIIFGCLWLWITHVFLCPLKIDKRTRFFMEFSKEII